MWEDGGSTIGSLIVCLEEGEKRVEEGIAGKFEDCLIYGKKKD
jgi:hypothetical protein